MSEPSYRARLREATRTDWRFLLGITPQSAVLDAHSADARIGRALLPWVGQVYRPCTRDVGAPVEALGPATSASPTPPDAFDWIFVGADASQPTENALRAAVQRARPGGHVALMLENRWGLHWLADWRSAGVDRSSTSPAMQGSVSAWRGRLREAGLEDIAVLALLPHHDAPRAIIPVDPSSPAAAQRHALDQVWQRATPGAAIVRWLLGLLVACGAMRSLYPHYLLVGRKPC